MCSRFIYSSIAYGYYHFNIAHYYCFLHKIIPNWVGIVSCPLLPFNRCDRSTATSIACISDSRGWWPWVYHDIGALLRQTGQGNGPDRGVSLSTFRFASRSDEPETAKKKIVKIVFFLKQCFWMLYTLFLFCLTVVTIFSICWRNSPLPAELVIDWLNESWIEVSSESSLFK